MANEWTQRWNQRYAAPEFAYGTEPNEFFREQLSKLKPGNLLLPAEGEGRNAVFAARMGWTVSAFDISSEGKKKAEQLATANGVSINYQVGELDSLDYAPGQFDALALIYAHFPAPVKAAMHRALGPLLRPGGTIIFEAFSKSHLDYMARNEQLGGPKDLASLFSIAEIRQDFPGYEILQLEEVEVNLDEGEFHKGTGSVIRFVGKKH